MKVFLKTKQKTPIRDRTGLFTLVVALDKRHLEQISFSWPTWRKHKPSFLANPMIVIMDDSISHQDVKNTIDHPALRIIEWPTVDIDFSKFTDGTRWTDRQRYKMLSAFVHIPARAVKTKYWLKVDTDVVATKNDEWVDKQWFAEQPAIVAHRWGYTKPPNQMLLLDEWIASNTQHVGFLNSTPPLNLVPKEGADVLKHRRIISWCAFFNTEFTQWVSRTCEVTCGPCQLPVPSQDGVMFYMAKRSGMAIVTPNMKELGWQQWNTLANIKKYAEEALA